MQPVSARYNATKVCYEIPRSEIQRVLSARGPVATAVVRNPPSSLFQVRKPTKQQALYGAAISIGMSVLFNLLFTQIDSNQYTQSQWYVVNSFWRVFLNLFFRFVNVLLYGIQWATVLSLLVGFGLLLGVFVGKFE